MKKLLWASLVLVLFSGLLGATCTPKPIPTDRWLQFTYYIGEVQFVDYIKITSMDSCKNVTAINEYGSLFIGKYKGKEPMWVSLEKARGCYYLDTFVFQPRKCLNPSGNYWHHGSFKCIDSKVTILCPSCEPLCSSVRLVRIAYMPKGFVPEVTEDEDYKQYRKWLAE